jgi:hypothetical protein
MHWFELRSNLALGAFQLWLQGEAKDREPVELVSDQPALFGPDENIPVHTLLRNGALALLHTEIFRYLVATRSEPSERRWVAAGYRPHVTRVGEKEFHRGSRYLAKTIAIIERDHSKVKRVIAVYELCGKA